MTEKEYYKMKVGDLVTDKDGYKYEITTIEYDETPILRRLKDSYVYPLTELDLDDFEVVEKCAKK